MHLTELHLHLVALLGMYMHRAKWRGLGEAVRAATEGGSQAWDFQGLLSTDDGYSNCFGGCKNMVGDILSLLGGLESL